MAVLGRLIHYLSIGMRKLKLIEKHHVVEINGTDFIPKEEKLLKTAFESTTIQHAFRKKKQNFFDSALNITKNEEIKGFFRRKFMKWKNEKEPNYQGK